MFNRIVNFISRVWHAVTNRYEGGQRGGTARSWLPAQVQDARYDAPQPVRSELVNKSRYWERNSGLMQRLIDLFEQYTAGDSGVQFMPDSSDEAWNKSAREYWEESCRFMDLSSLQSYGSLCSLSARSWFVDGGVFILKTRGQTQVDGKNVFRPRIQLIETQRLENPAGRIADNIDSGIEVDDNGRPINYYIRTGYNGDKIYPFPASQVIPLSEPPRPGMLHGLPFAYAVLNDLHDLEDLMMFEMLAAKDAAEKSTVIKNAAGQISTANLQRQIFNQTTQNTAGEDIMEQRTRWLKQSLGGRTLALKPGEDIVQFMPNRPTSATKEHWEILTTKICAGVGISKLLVYPSSMQGTVTRADLDVQAGFFRSRFNVLAAAWYEVYLYFMDFGIKYDPRLRGAPADWRKVQFFPPRSVNVDVGRNSAAVLAELEAGLSTYQAEYAKLGLDSVTQLRQKGREAKLIRQIAQEEGVTPGEIAKAVGQQLLAAQQAEAQKQNQAA